MLTVFLSGTDGGGMGTPEHVHRHVTLGHLQGVGSEFTPNE